MKVGDLESNDPKILIYGPPGTAKTSLVLTLGNDLEYWDLDDNLDVAFGLDDGFKDKRLDVNVQQFVDRTPKKSTAFPALKRHLMQVQMQCNAGTFPYPAIAVDSLSALAAMAQRYIMCNSSMYQKNPQIQHWGMILTEIENIVTDLRALPVLVFYIAHQTIFSSDDITQVQISLPGVKLPGKITRMFSEIWYTRIQPTGGGNQEFYLQTAPTSSVTCRSGRGLETGTVFAKADAKGRPTGTVGLWDILAKIRKKETSPVKQ